jgi:hypothetical protein
MLWRVFDVYNLLPEAISLGVLFILKWRALTKEGILLQ